MPVKDNEMVLKEVNFEILDFVQTADGKSFSIGFKDNENKKTLSKKTVLSMYQQGQIIKKTVEIEGETVFESLSPRDNKLKRIAL